MSAAAATYARSHFRRVEHLDGGQLELALDRFRESLSRSIKLRALVKRRRDLTLGEVRELLSLVVSLYGASARVRFATSDIDRRPVRRVLLERLERIFEDRLSGDGWPSPTELRELTVDLLQEFGFEDMADRRALDNAIRQRNHQARKRTTARRCKHCSTPARDVRHAPGEPCPDLADLATHPR